MPGVREGYWGVPRRRSELDFDLRYIYHEGSLLFLVEKEEPEGNNVYGIPTRPKSRLIGNHHPNTQVPSEPAPLRMIWWWFSSRDALQVADWGASQSSNSSIVSRCIGLIDLE